MRDLYDDMLDDIEEQEKKKPTQFPINEVNTDFNPSPQSLNNITPYEMSDEQEDDFDIVYRTPKDVTIDDLIPTDYIIDDEKEGSSGSYDPYEDKISVRSEGYLKKKYPNQDPKKLQRGILAHEGFHRDWNDAYNNSNGTSLLKEKRMQNEYRQPFLETMVATKQDTPEERKEFDEEFDDIVYFHTQDMRKKHSKKVDNFRNIIENKYENFSRLNEGHAFYGQAFPNQVLNPTNKIGRRLNRNKFKEAPIWGMEV